jgi:hypothetical protein
MDNDSGETKHRSIQIAELDRGYIVRGYFDEYSSQGPSREMACMTLSEALGLAGEYLLGGVNVDANLDGLRAMYGTGKPDVPEDEDNG